MKQIISTKNYFFTILTVIDLQKSKIPVSLSETKPKLGNLFASLITHSKSWF